MLKLNSNYARSYLRETNDKIIDKEYSFSRKNDDSTKSYAY